jgi:hypothetical protein
MFRGRVRPDRGTHLSIKSKRQIFPAIFQYFRNSQLGS